MERLSRVSRHPEPPGPGPLHGKVRRVREGMAGPLRVLRLQREPGAGRDGGRGAQEGGRGEGGRGQEDPRPEERGDEDRGRGELDRQQGGPPGAQGVQGGDRGGQGDGVPLDRGPAVWDRDLQHQGPPERPTLEHGRQPGRHHHGVAPQVHGVGGQKVGEGRCRSPSSRRTNLFPYPRPPQHNPLPGQVPLWGRRHSEVQRPRTDSRLCRRQAQPRLRHQQVERAPRGVGGRRGGRGGRQGGV
mmetsp:Transcript_21383/g.53686  ORF Transcript_21383/g.53686 Transcript_21383/m.53686 type:complete len:243 (+) Transcript_21383:296-1024(+)